jgi:hypothetical protein
MNLEKLSSLFCRLGFFGAFVLFAIAVLERIANVFDYTILKTAYSPGRLLEFAGILLILVIALVLRQVREELKKKA